MTEFYELTTPGTVPVSLADMKAYMKVTALSDDVLITSMLAAATRWGENYTGREFRANVFTLLLDSFTDRLCLRRAPVDTIISIKHLVAATLTTVAASVYYLKANTQFSEILLNEDQAWPTDTDSREQAIEVIFVTKTYPDIESIATAIKRHVAYWYSNRGDCGSSGGAKGCSCGDAAQASGATIVYDQFRISRV